VSLNCGADVSSFGHGSWQGHLHGRASIALDIEVLRRVSLRDNYTHFFSSAFTMAQFGRYRFLLVAIIFHLTYIYSIFSIYFVSPVVHGMREHQVDQEAPAKRLVLIVGMRYNDYARIPSLTSFNRRRSPRRQSVPIVPESRSQSSPNARSQLKYTASSRPLPSL